MIFLLFSLLFFFSNIAESEFIGKSKWSTDDMELCNIIHIDSVTCLSYVHKFWTVNLEILSWEPSLVIYRDFLTKNQVSNFLKTIAKRQLDLQKTVTDGGDTHEISEYRQANGSFFEHSFNPDVFDIYRTTQHKIPGIEFESSESFSALSYSPNGHYAPHYDYLEYESEKQYDYWMKKYRNRVATLIYVLKSAKNGGGTVFPNLGTTVRAEAGDAFMWFNARGDESLESLSLHGGCPVYEGEKVIVTMWIRAKQQPILSLTDSNKPISADWLIPGFAENIRNEIPTQCQKLDQ